MQRKCYEGSSQHSPGDVCDIPALLRQFDFHLSRGRKMFLHFGGSFSSHFAVFVYRFSSTIFRASENPCFPSPLED